MLNKLLWIFILTGLAACVSTPPPNMPSRESEGAAAQSVPVGSDVSAAPPAAPVIQSAEPRSDLIETNPALEQLLDQAVASMARAEYDRAVSLAQRAMNVDRYDPRVFLMLARAHRSLGNLAQSREYAERGLAFTEPDTSIYRALRDLR